jgi:hypothetical protein
MKIGDEMTDENRRKCVEAITVLHHQGHIDFETYDALYKVVTEAWKVWKANR